MNAEQFTPRQQALLRRMWRLYKTDGILRRQRIFHRAFLLVTALFLVASVVAIVNEWPAAAVAVLSFLTGGAVALAGTSRGRADLWPAFEAVIDWERLSQLAGGDKEA